MNDQSQGSIRPNNYGLREFLYCIACLFSVCLCLHHQKEYKMIGKVAEQEKSNAKKDSGDKHGGGHH